MIYHPGAVRKQVADGDRGSPLVDLREIEGRRGRLWPEFPPTRGIDYREPAQHALFEELTPLIADFGFPPHEGEKPGYYFFNGQFGGLDAIVYFALLRALRPAKIVEVGSGYSTMLAIETHEKFLNGLPEITCIEPFPMRDRTVPLVGKVHFLPVPVQTVDPSVVDGLGRDDILFVDCSHVSKTGSDIQRIYFDLFPRLAPGVLIQIHDIFLPFEYPYGWVAEGRHWNEQYVLQALLTGSRRYEIAFGSAFFSAFHGDAVERACGRVFEGGSLWLRVTDGSLPRRPGSALPGAEAKVREAQNRTVR